MHRIAPQVSIGLYSLQVEAMMNAGVPFEDLEQAIQATDLTDDEKAALWLLAWSLETPTVQRKRHETLGLIAGESQLPAGAGNGTHG
jgi:hypothetical protein